MAVVIKLITTKHKRVSTAIGVLRSIAMKDHPTIYHVLCGFRKSFPTKIVSFAISKFEAFRYSTSYNKVRNCFNCIKLKVQLINFRGIHRLVE